MQRPLLKKGSSAWIHQVSIRWLRRGRSPGVRTSSASPQAAAACSVANPRRPSRSRPIRLYFSAWKRTWTSTAAQSWMAMRPCKTLDNPSLSASCALPQANGARASSTMSVLTSLRPGRSARPSKRCFRWEGDMADHELPTNDTSEKVAEARRLAEQGLHEQAVGNNAEADRLLAQALEIEPDAVADVLREHDAGRAPDARLQDLADQDVEKVLPRITPGPA